MEKELRHQIHEAQGPQAPPPCVVVAGGNWAGRGGGPTEHATEVIEITLRG